MTRDSHQPSRDVRGRMHSRDETRPVRNVRWSDRTAIVEVAGEVDMHRSPTFQQQLLSVLDERPKRIAVNLRDVPSLDSSGLASLVKLLAQAQEQDVPVALYGLNDRVRGIFEITRLEAVFEIHDSEREALA